MQLNDFANKMERYLFTDRYTIVSIAYPIHTGLEWESPGFPVYYVKSMHGDKSDSAICLWHAMLSYLLWGLAAQDQIVQEWEWLVLKL